jgi:hypothetical protein
MSSAQMLRFQRRGPDKLVDWRSPAWRDPMRRRSKLSWRIDLRRVKGQEGDAGVQLCQYVSQTRKGKQPPCLLPNDKISAAKLLLASLRRAFVEEAQALLRPSARDRRPHCPTAQCMALHHRSRQEGIIGDGGIKVPRNEERFRAVS